MDFECDYRNNIYYDFVGVYEWMGEDFTRRLLSKYNELAQLRDVHLPKCKAYPLKLDFDMVPYLSALRLFQQLPRQPHLKDQLLQLLQKLCPL